MAKTEKEWQAEMDAATLAEAGAIDWRRVLFSQYPPLI